jgi:hypothetical protein
MLSMKPPHWEGCVMKKTADLRALCIAAAMGIASGIAVGTEANAAFVPLSIVSDSSWSAECFGSGPREGSCSDSPIAAYAPYPNPVDHPDPATTNGQYMWYWDPSDPTNPTSLPTGANGSHGPIHFTHTTANLSSISGTYGAWLAADDFEELFVNGTSVGTYSLDAHKDPVTGFPVPVFVDFTSELHTGVNALELRACDGISLSNCFDRGFEAAFFDAEHGPTQQPVFISGPAPIPEPSSLSLLSIAALATLTLIRKRTPRRSRHKTA